MPARFVEALQERTSGWSIRHPAAVEPVISVAFASTDGSARHQNHHRSPSSEVPKSFPTNTVSPIAGLRPKKHKDAATPAGLVRVGLASGLLPGVRDVFADVCDPLAVLDLGENKRAYAAHFSGIAVHDGRIVRISRIAPRMAARVALRIQADRLWIHAADVCPDGS